MKYTKRLHVSCKGYLPLFTSPYKTYFSKQTKVFGLAILLLVSSITAQHAAAQTPDSTNLPVVWLRADKGEIIPAIWSDYSGNKHHATSINGQEPLRNGLLNYNPAFIFDGIDDYMKIAYSVEGLSQITVIAVFQSADTAETGVWGAENALSRNVMLTTRRAAGPDSAIVNIGKNEKLAILNTVVQNWTRSSAINQAAYLALGSAGKQQTSKPFKGMLAELLVFDKKLDLLTQIQYETYLAIKYGIPVTDQNYVSTAEKVLWPAEENKDYKYRITGLGKDEFFLLDQKQSKSAFDTTNLLIMSAGSLAKTNAGNTASINNGDYLVWGDNNGALTASATADGALQILNRKWLMHVTTTSASASKANIWLDLKQLPSSPKGYWLVINPSASTEFLTDQLSYIQADSISRDSIAYYGNVNWDADRSGKDLFSFAKANDLLAVMHVLDSPSCQNLSAGKAGVRVLGGHAPFQYELKNTITGNLLQGTIPGNSSSVVLKDLSMGKYTFTLKDADGHEAIRQFSLTVPHAVSVELGPGQQMVPGNEIVLDATTNISSDDHVQYRWKSSYGFTSSEGKIRIRETGIYHVDVITAEGCVFSDEIVISGAEKQRFAVFPTISQDGTYNVSVSLPKKGNVSVSVFDMRGSKHDEMVGKNNTEFSFTGHLRTTGMYTIVLKTAKGTETKKVIVQY